MLFCLLDINVIKNQINSLLFVKKVCETRVQRLQSGKVGAQRDGQGIHLNYLIRFKII